MVAMTRSLPSLGPHGEGWLAIQVVLFLAIFGAGWLGPAWEGPARLIGAAVGLALIAAGGILAVRAVFDLRHGLTPLPYPRPDASLVEAGAYRWVRHPIYTGLVVAGLGWGLATASPAAIALDLVLLGFFDVKSRREEAWLVERYPGYAAYRRRTRRLVPFIY